MNLKKIEHIGIAVSDIKTSNLLFEKLLGAKKYKEEEVPSEGVTTSFFKTGENKNFPCNFFIKIKKRSPANN